LTLYSCDVRAYVQASHTFLGLNNSHPNLMFFPVITIDKRIRHCELSTQPDLLDLKLNA